MQAFWSDLTHRASPASDRLELERSLPAAQVRYVYRATSQNDPKAVVSVFEFRRDAGTSRAS